MDSKKAFCAALLPAAVGFAIITPVRAAPENEADAWSVTLGAGVANFPKYPGSRARRVEPLPVISIRHGRFFLGGVPGAGTPAGVGAYLYEGDHWKLGVAVGGDVIKPRKESDDRRHLRGLGDINGTVQGGMFASYTLAWFTIQGSAFYDLEDHRNHEGMQGSLEAVAKYSPCARLTLSAGPGVAFANRRYMQTFFGIDAIQSERSDYAEYFPKPGLELISFSLGADYRLTSHWRLGARVTAGRLQGDAAHSVIVESKNQNIYAMFVAYRY